MYYCDFMIEHTYYIRQYNADLTFEPYLLISRDVYSMFLTIEKAVLGLESILIVRCYTGSQNKERSLCKNRSAEAS